MADKQHGAWRSENRFALPHTPNYLAMDLPHSDDCFVVAFPAEATEAFLEGHVRAFAYFGGVPTRILYDNTKIAVAKISAEKNGSGHEPSPSYELLSVRR